MAKSREDNIKSRYRQINTKFGDSYIDIIPRYFIKYYTFMEKFNDSISRQINYDNLGFEIFINNQENNAKQILNDLNQDLSNFSKVFENELREDESIEQIADCIFIQRDIYKGFNEAYYSFGMKLTIVSILHLIIGIFEAVLFIIYYFLFANMIRDNKEVEELSKKNNEILGALVRN